MQEKINLQAEKNEEIKSDSRLGAEELARIFGEVKDSDKPEDKAKEVYLYTQWAEVRLKRYLGVEDMKLVEKENLKQIVESLLPQFRKEKKLVADGDMNPQCLAELEQEAAILWLNNVYGIHQNQISWIYAIEDLDTGEKFYFEHNQKDEAEKREKELEAQGRNTFLSLEIPPEFKEYFRRERLRMYHEYYE